MRFCGDFYFKLRFYKTKRFAVIRNFRVISTRFAGFLCYSVRYLYVFLCGFAVFVPPLRPPLVKTPLFSQKFESQCSNPDKIKAYTLRDIETRYIENAGDYSIEFTVP